MRRRRHQPLAVAAITGVLLVGCETESTDDLDAEFEELEDDSGDGEPIDRDPDVDAETD
jgi:hypothetical protein